MGTDVRHKRAMCRRSKVGSERHLLRPLAEVEICDIAPEHRGVHGDVSPVAANPVDSLPLVNFREYSAGVRRVHDRVNIKETFEDRSQNLLRKDVDWGQPISCTANIA